MTQAFGRCGQEVEEFEVSLVIRRPCLRLNTSPLGVKLSSVII